MSGYGYGHGYGYGLSVAASQLLISYDFDNTFQILGQMYSKNNGSFSEDLALNSGQGAKLFTTNTITGPINTTILTEIYTKDGVVTVNEGSQVLTDYVIGNDNSIHKDYYLFTDALTPQEISKYSTNPNAFFIDVQNGVIDNCVLNMPLDGTDEFVRDYENYSEGVELSEQDYLQSSWVLGSGWSSSLGNLVATNTISAQAIQNISLGVGIFQIEFEVLSLSGDSFTFVYGSTNIGEQTEIKKYSLLINISSPETRVDFRAWFGTGLDAEITPLSIKELTGIHEITNNTTSTRTEAQELPYGSQEANFLRDGLWRGGISKYQEFFNVSDDGETSWTPPATFQVEEIVELNGVLTHFVFDSLGNKYTNGIADGTYTIPLIAIILNNTTFDSVSTVTQRKLFEAKANLDSLPLDLYNSAVSQNLLLNHVIDSGQYVTDAQTGQFVYDNP